MRRCPATDEYVSKNRWWFRRCWLSYHWRGQERMIHIDRHGFWTQVTTWPTRGVEGAGNAGGQFRMSEEPWVCVTPSEYVTSVTVTEIT